MLRFTLIACLLLLICILPMGASLAQDWHNVRLNTDLTSQVQNEQQVVVNPTNPMNLVAIWRDFRLGYRQVGYGYSMDGGRTWTNPGLFVDPHYPNDSDPALTVSSEGTFYAMLLAYTGNTSETNGMLMYRSTNGGVEWEERGFAINQVPGVFEDKEFIACDRTSSPHHGRIYCVWDRFYETNIYCVSSGDEGATWTTARRVSNVSSNQFPTPAVGPDGTLYVAWTNFSGYLRIDKSTDGGLTFGSDTNITSIYNPHPTVNGGIQSPCHPAMDIDITGGPYNGRIYVVYLNRVSSNDYDIYIRHSDDQAATWSTARRINDDTFNNGRDQFHPWLTVDNSGVLTAVWLDRRHDPSNYLWHCYLSQSFDGGMTWTPNQQVSTAPSSPGDALASMPKIDPEADRMAKISSGPRLPGPIRRAMEREASARDDLPAEDDRDWDVHPDQDQTRAGLIGEYIGIASYDGFATAVWTDTRLGHQDTYAGIDAAALAVEDIDSILPERHLVVAPNPASGPIGLAYRVPSDGWVDLEVFDVNGRRVRTLVGRNLRTGDHQFVWDGTDQAGREAAPGSYYVRFRAPGVEKSVSVQLLP